MEKESTIVADILALPPDKAVERLKEFKGNASEWSELEKMYNVKMHEVNNVSDYADDISDDGIIDKKVRATYSFAKLTANRATGWTVGIPPKRTYNLNADSNGDQIEKARVFIEKIYKSVKINAIHRKRVKKYYSCCQVLTLWFATETTEPHTKYGIPTKTKLHCRIYSPMDGYKIYPMFDTSGDYVAVSIESEEQSGDTKVKYFDVFTATNHYQYVDDGNGYIQGETETITIGKNPTIYTESEDCIYADSIDKVYESEWVVSRTGNYVKNQTQPRVVITSDEIIAYGDEERDANSGEAGITQLPANGNLRYATWELNKGAIDFYADNLINMAFEETQIPNISFNKMVGMNLSGEAFDRTFIDARLKVIEEAGTLEELAEREFSVVCAFAKVIDPALAKAIDLLDCDHTIVPFTVRSKSDEIKNVSLATGGKAVMSQLEGIQEAGYSKDPAATLEQIKTEEMQDGFNLTE